MRRVLLVTYYFPPLGGGGVQRPLQWVRELPAHGWLPTVLTVESGYWSSRDEAGLARIPPEIEVVRTPFLSAVTIRERMRGGGGAATLAPATAPERSALRRAVVDAVKPLWQTPDEFLGWYPYAVRAGRKLLAAQRFDAILSTAPPFTTHLIGRALRKSSGLPWVTDFRDAWTRMPEYPHTNRIQLAIERAMERRVLTAADRILTTTEPTARDFAEILPSVAEKSHVIPNGYDPALFDFSAPSPYERGEKLRLLFTGTQLYGQHVARFLQSLASWCGNDAEKRDAVRLVYAGPESNAVRRAATASRSSNLLEDMGYLTNTELAEVQMRADVLLLIGYDRISNEKILPGKIFEYLGARRPILCLSHPGPRAQIVAESGAGIVASPDDPAALMAALDGIWREWRENRLDCGSDLVWIESRFSRARQAGALAGVLNSLRAS